MDLIEKELVGAELINDWVSELEKTISNKDATKYTDNEIKETRETIGNLITLSMESWYINQNIAGILRKCSQASGISDDMIERDRIISKNFPESFMILNLPDFHSIYILIRKKNSFFCEFRFKIYHISYY